MLYSYLLSFKGFEEQFYNVKKSRRTEKCFVNTKLSIGLKINFAICFYFKYICVINSPLWLHPFKEHLACTKIFYVKVCVRISIQNKRFSSFLIFILNLNTNSRKKELYSYVPENFSLTFENVNRQF